MCEISASRWFYYKEIYYDARSHERKKKHIELLFSEGTTCKLNSRHSIPREGEDSLLRHHTQSGSWPQSGS
jgi:hypothetical protein